MEKATKTFQWERLNQKRKRKTCRGRKEIQQDKDRKGETKEGRKREGDVEKEKEEKKRVGEKGGGGEDWRKGGEKDRGFKINRKYTI